MVRKMRQKIEVKDGTVGEGVRFTRLRRITGYLSPLERWNNAKMGELKDRVIHGGVEMSCGCTQSE